MTPPESSVARRTVLTASAAGVAGLTLTVHAAGAGAAPAVFQHGIASGDPLPTAVVLWTRVTPTESATPGSGRGPAVAVTWQVATDESFRRIVRSGTVSTGAARDHTVKVDAGGLRPDTDYAYRFLCAGQTSPVGRTRTAPRADADNGRLRLGVVSCANLQAGWFSAYRHLADRTDLDAILHLGDYLYEYAPGQYGLGRDNVDVRAHVPPREMVSLADYRQRHAQYKQDADLQLLHRRYPFIVTWDDHEVTNDQWAGGAENHDASEGDYLSRRAAAHRAYDEWMPVRLAGTAATGDGTRIYRRLRWGRLAELSLLDLRTYRSQQVGQNGTPIATPDAAAGDPDRTITGDAQMTWLKESLSNDRALWKLVGNAVMIAPVLVPPLPTTITDAVTELAGVLPPDGAPYNADQWDGYTADRREIVAHLRDRGVQNTVFLTGDIHSAWAADLPVDAGLYPLTETVATEFVCTSVTSNNLKDITGTPPRTTSLAVEAAITTANRHVKYLNFDDHGYSVLDVTRDRLQMDWFVISDRADRGARSTRTASWQTRVNSQKVTPAAKGLD